MHSDTRSRAFEARIECLRDVTAFIREGAVEACLPELQIGRLELLVEEVFVNVCRYAYSADEPGSATISYRITGGGELAVEVTDRGIEFNPLETAPLDIDAELDDRPVGGVGIHLLKALAPSLNYRREDGSNRLSFRISSDS